MSLYLLTSGKGSKWDPAHGQLMEVYCSSIYVEDFGKHADERLKGNSILLTYGRIGNKLYDLMNTFLLKEEDFTPNILKLLQSFCMEVDIHSYMIIARRVIMSNKFVNENDISMFLALYSLIMAGYQKGHVVGLHSSTKEVAVTTGMDPVETIAYLLLSLQKDKKIVLSKKIKVSDKRRVKLLRYLSKRDLPNAIREISKLPASEQLKSLNKLRSASIYSYASNMFNEVSSDFYYVNGVFDYSRWEREDTLTGSSPVINTYKLFVDSGKTPNDLLKKRDLYVRDKGVCIRFKQTPDNITSIAVREYHTLHPLEEHILLIFYTYIDGSTRFIPIDMTKIRSSLVFIMYEADVSAIFLILEWLGVSDLVEIDDSLFSRHKSFPKEIRQTLIKLTKDVLAEYKRLMNPDNLVYETPTHWNYATPVMKKTGSPKPLITEEIHIGRYTRKLPLGQKPSLEAQSLAKEVFIELDEGKTLVDEFMRRQRVRG